MNDAGEQRKNEAQVFLNGEFLPASQAKLNIYDLGLVMGATFTEMTRTFAHAPFRLEDHIARLFASLEYGGIAISYSTDEVLGLTHQLVKANTKTLVANHDLAIVHFVTAGENPIYGGLAPASTPPSPTVCIHSFPLAFSNWKNLMTYGAHLVVPSTRHLPSACIDPRTKHRSRLHWWLAEREVKKQEPGALALLLDMNGYLTECAASNFLLVKNETIYSPRAENILGGISLKTTRELCADLKLKWVEKDLTVEDVSRADEAWLTSTGFCITPATKINNAPIGNGRIGPLYERVLGAWNARVGLDIRAQILKSSY